MTLGRAAANNKKKRRKGTGDRAQLEHFFLLRSENWRIEGLKNGEAGGR